MAEKLSLKSLNEKIKKLENKKNNEPQIIKASIEEYTEAAKGFDMNRMTNYWVHTFRNGIAVCDLKSVILVRDKQWRVYWLKNWEKINTDAEYVWIITDVNREWFIE